MDENKSSTLNNGANSEAQQLLSNHSEGNYSQLPTVIIVCLVKSDIHVDSRVLADSSQCNEWEESQTTNCINNAAEGTGASMWKCMGTYTSTQN